MPGSAGCCRSARARAGKAQVPCSAGTIVAAYGEGLIAVLVPDEPDETCGARLRRLRGRLRRPRLSGADPAPPAERPAPPARARRPGARGCGVPTVVTNDVLFHEPGRRILQDVVTCIRHSCTIDELGFRRERHADRYLKPPAEMQRLFAPLSGGAGAHAARSPSAAASRSTSSPTSIPEERDDPGADAAADAGAADLGGRRRALSRGRARQGARRCSSTSCG